MTYNKENDVLTYVEQMYSDVLVICRVRKTTFNYAPVSPLGYHVHLLHVSFFDMTKKGHRHYVTGNTEKIDFEEWRRMIVLR